jgi:thiamine biosynthesis lipoprotein
MTHAKRPFRLLFLVTAALLFINACSSNDSVYTGHFEAFGGQVDVTIVGVPVADARKAVETLKQDLAYMERAWDPDGSGALARVNRLLATGAPFSAPPSILPLIDRGRTLALLADGLLNPAFGKVRALWKFESNSAEGFRPPDRAAVDELLRMEPSLQDISVNGFRLRSSNEAVALDFSEFMVGYAVDQAVLRLLELGIHDAMVNIGGNLRAIGSRAGHPWRVPVRRDDGTGVLATLDIQGDESIITVGTFEQYGDFEGRRYHDILDPRNGWPAEGVRTVTVVHRDATTAHATATALFVAGRERWSELAGAMGVDQAMVIDAEGTLHLSPRLEPRLRFMGGKPGIRIIGEMDSR